MYQNHMPLLREHAQNYEGFRNIVTFVLLSIRQPFVKTPEQMESVRYLGEASPYLWGWKRSGYVSLATEVGKQAWEGAIKAPYAQEAIKALLPIPGLGITKSGFVAQMLGFDVGCLDTRNEKRLGITPRMFRVESDRCGPKTVDRKVNAYVEMCHQEGGAAHLWDSWCTDLAEEYELPPAHVSALHLAAIR